MTPEEIASLNPGIRRTVALLNAAGFETCDSGDGQTHDCECDREYPYVVVLCDPENLKAECDRVFTLLQAKGIDMQEANERGDAPYLQGSYDPGNGLGIIDICNVVDSMLSGDAPS